MPAPAWLAGGEQMPATPSPPPRPARPWLRASTPCSPRAPPPPSPPPASSCTARSRRDWPRRRRLPWKIGSGPHSRPTARATRRQAVPRSRPSQRHGGGGCRHRLAGSTRQHRPAKGAADRRRARHAALLAELRGFAPLLLLDEPTVHLDAERRAALFGPCSACGASGAYRRRPGHFLPLRGLRKVGKSPRHAVAGWRLPAAART